MNQENTIEKKSFSFFSILTGIVFKPVKTWKTIAEEKNFTHLWTWYFTLAAIGSALMFFQPLAKAVQGVFLFHIVFWASVLILWVLLILGLKISGVETSLNFTHLFRFMIYNSTIDTIYYLINLLRNLFFPELKSIYQAAPDDTLLIVIYYILWAIELLYWVWFVLLLVIAVKQVYRISYKRSVSSVLCIPIAGTLFVFSIILLRMISS